MFWNCDLKNNFYVRGSCFLYGTMDPEEIETLIIVIPLLNGYPTKATHRFQAPSD